MADCLNEDDIFTTTPLTELPEKDFVCIRRHGFDLASIFNWVVNLEKPIHPFTNERLNETEIADLQRIAIERYPLTVTTRCLSRRQRGDGRRIPVKNTVKTTGLLCVQKFMSLCWATSWAREDDNKSINMMFQEFVRSNGGCTILEKKMAFSELGADYSNFQIYKVIEQPKITVLVAFKTPNKQQVVHGKRYLKYAREHGCATEIFESYFENARIRLYARNNRRN